MVSAVIICRATSSITFSDCEHNATKRQTSTSWNIVIRGDLSSCHWTTVTRAASAAGWNVGSRGIKGASHRYSKNDVVTIKKCIAYSFNYENNANTYCRISVRNKTHKKTVSILTVIWWNKSPQHWQGMTKRKHEVYWLLLKYQCKKQHWTSRQSSK